MQHRFLEIIRTLQTTPSPNLNPPLFIFKLNTAAAEYNAKILKGTNFNLKSIIDQQHLSQLSFGSKFRSPKLLEELLHNHPFWPRLKQLLTNGASFPLTEISPVDRLMDLKFHEERGNHKSATVHNEELKKLIKEDVERGFTLPLPVSVLYNLPKASLAPLGCVQQSSIDASGKRIVKYRMTHDQSFPGLSNQSVNKRVKFSELPPIMYSFVLLRTVHYIIGVRQRHLTVRIFLCKFDIDSAYRRCTLAETTAMESLAIFGAFLLVALRLTFGGAPGPSIWGILSETITDIGNSLLINQLWDHKSLYEDISLPLEVPLSLPEEIPFAQAKTVSVNIPAVDTSKIDIYIDDSIGVAPDIGETPSRVARAIPLAIRTMARPLSLDDVLPRKDLISMKRLQAEGQLSEVRVILGWEINTRSLSIAIPEHKATAWIKDIESIIETGQSNYKLLESLLGRLNHVAGILTPMRHFMGRFYRALYRAKAYKGWTTMSPNELQDLGLHADFIHQAKNGISLNLVTYRKPTVIYRSDASEFGLGGYNLVTGRAWRWEIPSDLRNSTSINSLEFLACLITIWIDIESDQIKIEHCILSQTDSTSAAGWLRKSNFADTKDESIQLLIARKLASFLITSKSCLYSQWFSGNENSISDSLSRDFHIEASNLSFLLASNFPDQAPFGLEILPLPNSIVSWVTSVLQLSLQEKPWLGEQAKSKFALGLASRTTYCRSESRMMHSWKTSTKVNDTKFSVPLSNPSERVDFLLSLPSISRLTQSEPPWTSWHRPSSWLIDQIQDWIPTESFHSFYSASSVDTSQQTLERPHRWQ
jgi:hypothetical protein